MPQRSRRSWPIEEHSQRGEVDLADRINKPLAERNVKENTHQFELVLFGPTGEGQDLCIMIEAHRRY